MMEEALKAFATMLVALDIPVSNGEFLDLTECPYISFFLTEDNSIYADGVPICLNSTVEIHLITKGIRDYDLEERVEELLIDNGYPYRSSYSQNTEQRVHETVYMTTIME